MENYIVSARKYRPDTFDTVVSQKALTTTLKNAIHSGKLAHAYLFCGPRGVGKTTCARIFAKTINCEHPTADGEPCNECESCRSFNQQRSYSIYELDAASNNSVDDIRSLNEQVRIPPQVGRYKVYIIDEVHMLSQAAFNAFLKTLEEPPAHAIFILATTEKHKIIPTILSRCQIYDFSRIGTSDIISHLQGIAEKEGINAEYEALRVIAGKSDGCMRDALSLFDQMVSFTQGNLTYSGVIDSLNILDYEYYFRLTEYIIEAKTSQALLLFNDVLSKGFDGSIFIDGAASHFRDLLVSSDNATIPLFEGSEELCKRYSLQAKRCTPILLFRAIRICNDCSMNYRTSRNKRLSVELAIIRLTQLTTDEGEEGVGQRPKIKPIFNKPQDVDSVAVATQQQPPRQEHTAQDVKPIKTVETEEHHGQPAAAQQPMQTARTQQQPLQGRPEALRQTPPKGGMTLGRMFQGVRSAMNTQNSVNTQTVQQAATENSDTSPTHSDNRHNPVTESMLKQAWMSFAMRLPEQERALADRMKILSPTLHDDGYFSIAVDNQLAAEMFEGEAKRITSGISNELGGAVLRMKIIVNKVVVERHIYDRTKQFEILKEKNPIISRLRDSLKLELS